MPKFGTANIGRAIANYTDGEEIIGYSKVVVEVSDDVVYEAGDNSGRTLTVTNPWGTQEMANSLLSKVKVARYKPYEATGAVIDPAMELGDTINVNGNTSRVYTLKTNFGRLVTAEVSAPNVEEMDEEAPYKSSTERKIIRQGKQMRTEFQVIAGEIRASIETVTSDLSSAKTETKQTTDSISASVTKLSSSLNGLSETVTKNQSAFEQTASEIRASVTKLSSNLNSLSDTVAKNQSTFEQTATSFSAELSTKLEKNSGGYETFGWNMYAPGEREEAEYKDGYFEIAANLKQLLYVSPRKGLVVNGSGTFEGTITAKAGKIGGFDIESNHLSYNGQTWGSENTYGAYIGSSGIQLGDGFKVDMYGHLTAKTGTFEGTVYAGEIEYGDDAGYFDGSGIAGESIYGGKIAGGTIGGYNIAGSTLGTAKFVSGVNASLGYANYSNDAIVNGSEPVYIGGDMFYLGGARIMKASREIDGYLVRYLSWTA